MIAEYPSLPSASPSARVHGPWRDLFGWGEAVAGIAQGVATTVAAHEQAGAARDAAKITADAATHGADLQDAAAQRTEAFQRQQADYAAQQQEVDRHANYDQYAANRRRIGSLGTMLGLGGVAVPDYVPGVTPHFATAPAPGAPGTAGGPPPPGAASGPPGAPMTMGGFPLPPGATTAPANFGAALAGAAPAAAAPPAGAPPMDPRLMAGNGGYTGGMATPVLQPDGTYAFLDSMPSRTIGGYLGAA